MQRRTFLKGAVAGAAVAAVPLDMMLAAEASAAVGSIAELQSAINRAVPGDRIVVADGTYTVPSGGIAVSGRNGTTSAPITIVAQTRGGVVLQGARSFVFANSSNVTVSGFAFRQSSTLAIPANCSRIRLTRNDFRFADVAGLDWVLVEGDDVKIDRNRFHDKTTEGIFVVVDGPGETAMAQRLHIFKNHFSDHSFAGENGGEPIRIGYSGRALTTADALVESNLFERCDGDPETISVKSSGNTIRHNTIRDSLGGIVLRHGNGTTVEGNHLLGGKDGIRLYGNDHVVVNNYAGGLSGKALVIGSGSTRDHHPGETEDERRGNDACDRAVVVHNTFVGNGGGIAGETRTYEPRNVVVADNLVVGDAGSLVAMGRTTGFTWQSNLLWGAAGNGNIPAGGFFRADPALARGADGVYRLTAGSAAVNRATLAGVSVPEDIDGHTRSGTRDVGADEFSTAAPVRRPLTPADVGPDAA
ncbi:polysaccharide lyase 6 family protein [Streptomyces bambusae]|uniref:polysaccharide lyase 6 family protein n=1 Tax=Streptomyces bambusae TaxID=1550616 RepID=UPI001CFF1116|nr:polysaccharide lyase 6 family protein [Streptomyces bambusae]MCB5167710.1 polysaccharide lyase 6 family protein [Streptomyces bambusae]